MANKQKILGVWLKNIYYVHDDHADLSHEQAHFVPALKDSGFIVQTYALEHNSDLALLEQVKKFKPDYLLMLVYKDNINLETITYISERYRVKTIAWNGDDEHQWGIDESWATNKIAPYFDYNITTFPSAVKKYHALGIERDKIILSQWGANHKLFKPRNIQKKYDVGFVGMWSKDRYEWIAPVVKKYDNLLLAGAGWDMSERSYLSYADYAKAFNKVRINLNYGYTGGKLQIKGRDFEVPMSGGFLLTTHNPLLSEYFKMGKEIETYKTKGEMIEKIDYYLKYPAKRERIAVAGYKRAIKDHKFTNRFKQLFHYISHNT